MGQRPSSKHSLDRINNDGNYEKVNCHWVLQKQQCRNKRNNRIIEFRGQSHSVVEWAEIVNMRSKVISDRLNKLHWSVELALTTPVKHRK